MSAPGQYIRTLLSFRPWYLPLYCFLRYALNSSFQPGFLGHGAVRGCSKCKKKFIPGKNFGDKMNFGGFENCLLRTNEEHRSEAQEILLEDTLQGREYKQTKYGTRYTELMQLEYFNCTRFTIIDPMHNLFLGTAKHMVKNIWLPNKKLKQADLKSIQVTIDSMKVPSNMGRIPNKIASSFGSFTSDQWKLWTVMYSEFTLKEFLPSEDYKLWLFFVKACRILTAPIITIRSLGEAHSFLMQFCKKFESMYGQMEVTPNMHLHTHIINCVLDYGPVHNFWLFSFEHFHRSKLSRNSLFYKEIQTLKLILYFDFITYFNDLGQQNVKNSRKTIQEAERF